MPSFTTKRAAAVLLLALATAPLAGGAAGGKGGGGGGTGGPIGSCIEQQPCLKWEVTKLSGSDNCGISPGLCPIKICMLLDTDATDCIKNGDTVSHTCDNADSAGCVRPDPWVQYGGGVDPEDGTGNCNAGNITAWENKCQEVPDGVRLCQIGKPGDVLFWNV
jgi:hypothetical protein